MLKDTLDDIANKLQRVNDLETKCEEVLAAFAELVKINQNLIAKINAIEEKLNQPEEELI